MTGLRERVVYTPWDDVWRSYEGRVKVADENHGGIRHGWAIEEGHPSLMYIIMDDNGDMEVHSHTRVYPYTLDNSFHTIEEYVQYYILKDKPVILDWEILPESHASRERIADILSAVFRVMVYRFGTGNGSHSGAISGCGVQSIDVLERI